MMMFKGPSEVFAARTIPCYPAVPELKIRGALQPDFKNCGQYTTLFPERPKEHQRYKPGMKMGHIRTDSTRRYQCAHLICAYLLSRKTHRAVVTSRDIARYHHLSKKASQSISALLNFLYTNRIRESRFGFYIMGTTPFSKYDYPHHFTIELIDGARGLL
jgi:hypothetical protein